jgi:hypothetical protein
VRVTIDTEQVIIRCLVRHVGSGLEAHVQSGLDLPAFFEACFLHAPICKLKGRDEVGD